MDDTHLDVPRRLDDPPSFIWEFDVWLVVLSSFVVGIASGWFLTCGAIGVFLGYLFQKARSGKTRGFFIHMLYWNLPLQLGMKRTPPSCVRHWIG
jgi:conjugal transfer pilus assembly protein TraL